MGKLEYAANAEIPFLNYFLPKERIAGNAQLQGFLEFSNGYFFTTGQLASAAASFEDWKAAKIKATYAYHYPERRMTLRNLTADALGGTASGSIIIHPLPGAPRFSVNLNYDQVDSAMLAHVAPWDPRYQLFSRLSGDLYGWIQGRIQDYDLEGNMSLSGYTPEEKAAGAVQLPIDGTAGFETRPGVFEVSGSDLRVFATTIRGNGVIQHKTAALNVEVESENLSDLAFIHERLNGKGSFTGTLNGPLSAPQLDGNFRIDEYKHERWTIAHAEGGASLDVQTQGAVLRAVKVQVGQSAATVDGTANFDGSAVDLRLADLQLRGTDLSSLMERRVEGDFRAKLHLTSLSPLRFDAERVVATDLVYEGRTLGNVQGDVHYSDPKLQVENLRAVERGATVVGDITYDRSTEAIGFEVRLTALALNRLRDLGVPETINGTLQEATLKGSGTRKQPEIEGTGLLRDLSFQGESFPVVRLTMSTNWPRMIVTMKNDQNLDLALNVNVAEGKYPFEASAGFTKYNVERLAGFSQGRIVVSGNARFSGLLTESSRIRGEGNIDSAQIAIPDHTIYALKPFRFSFDTNQLTLSNVSLTEREGTQMDIEGTIGLSTPARLGLKARGSFDLSLLTASSKDWTANGMLTFDGDIGGTTQLPDLGGSAHIANGSLEREGTYVTLSALNGDAVFNGNRVTLTGMEGRVGGGLVRIQGSGALQNNQIADMNLRIEADDVRFRYPEGLRTVLDGTLVLSGNLDSPLLNGDLQIQSLAYRNDFEEFLALFQPGGLDDSGSILDRIRLSIRVTGSRDIRIQNQLADVEAIVALDIRGTAGKPTMTGHVEASGGTLTFQGNQYEITRGNIDFVDPLRIDPVIDIQAEAEIRDYRVILGIAGRGDRMKFTPRSDPPLSQLELIGLIAGGKTRDELATESAGQQANGGRPPGVLPTGEELFKGGAASILFNEVLGNRFGLLGLDRVRIDPYLVGADRASSTRITLSEQVTKDLSVTYSQDLATNQQRVILVEYFLSKSLSIVASREENAETTALGLDMRLRKRF
jgi:autotransporter translocation and assembly factor TamB